MNDEQEPQGLKEWREDAAARINAWKPRADIARPRVKPLVWHDRLVLTDGSGFVCSVGGVTSYSIMLSKFRVYGIPGDHDGAAQFPTLEAAKAAAQADYEARILAALDMAPLTPAEAMTLPEVAALVEAARKVHSSFWYSSDGVIQGMYDLERSLAPLTDLKP